VVDGVVAHFALDSGWPSEFREFGKRLSTGVPLLMVLTLGISELAACAGEDNDVTPFIRRLFRQSTRRPKWERKNDADERLCGVE
jgi:hypothetical protein